MYAAPTCRVVGMLQACQHSFEGASGCDTASEPLVFIPLQSLSLGLGEQWEQVKAAYAQANRALGDIVKVSPCFSVTSSRAMPHHSYQCIRL